MKPRKDKHEAQRLKALHQCNILDTSGERFFDEITELASSICRTPIALISLIDADRQWFKSKVGLGVTETPRILAFCHHAISDPDKVMVVEDATKDSRFRHNALVTGAPFIRFYAGAPITVGDQFTLGTLCIIDTVPRMPETSELNSLRYLCKQVADELEIRYNRSLKTNGRRNQDTSGALAPPLNYTYVQAIISALRELDHFQAKHSKAMLLRYDITLSQFLCLQALEYGSTLNVSDLAEIVSLTSSTLIGILDRLEKRGLIERERDVSDRRNLKIQISHAGLKLIDEVNGGASNPLHSLIEHLPGTEQQILYRILQNLVVRVKAKEILN